MHFDCFRTSAEVSKSLRKNLQQNLQYHQVDLLCVTVHETHTPLRRAEQSTRRLHEGDGGVGF